MRYDNKFFSNETQAKAFKKQHGGVLLHVTPRSRAETKLNFQAEMAVAYDARGEIVDPEKTPWCVAWNNYD